MHSFKFRELARDFRVSSYLFIASAITALITLLCSALFFFTSQQIFILTAASSGGLFIFLWLGFWGRSNRSRCQLCNTPVFKRLRCNKSSQARPLCQSDHAQEGQDVPCPRKDDLHLEQRPTSSGRMLILFRIGSLLLLALLVILVTPLHSASLL